ncbi:MAG: MFS transporter [Candidatus Dormibacter sp.]
MRRASGLTRDTYLLAFTSLFADISTEMLYPVLPIFITQVLRATPGTLGGIEGVANATQYIVQGPSGWLSDRIRSRRLLAAAGYLLAALAKPLIGISTSWSQALGGRFVDRFGTGTRSAPRDALIAASASDDARGRAFGLEGVGDNLGAFIGPLLAILLLFSMRYPMRSLFYLALVPGLLSFILVLFVREPRVEPTDAAHGRARDLPSAYWKYLLATGVFGVGNSTNALLILRAQNVGLSLEETILVYAGFNLCAALASYPSGYLSDRFGRKPTLIAALGIFVVTYAGFAIGRSIIAVASLFVLYGLFQGTYRAVGKALASDLSPVWLRGTGLGFYSSSVGLTSLVASVAGGQLWDRLGPAATFWYGAALGVVGIVAMLMLVSASKPQTNTGP